MGLEKKNPNPSNEVEQKIFIFNGIYRQLMCEGIA